MMTVNGKVVKYKNGLVLEVVKQYIAKNLNKTYTELRTVFKDSLQGSIGVIKNENDLNEWGKNQVDNARRARFFIDNPIVKNFEKIYVCTEWGSSTEKNPDGNFEKFVEFARNDLKFEIEVLKKNIFSEQNSINIKNIILYGAPGVGKTHNYQNLISMIEEGKKQKEVFDIISSNKEVKLNNTIFKKVKEEKRVEFVTFHQNYSYEDFIEGFRPDNNGNIELKDGIFKRISEYANNNSEKSYTVDKLIFDDAFNVLLRESIENTDVVKINLKKIDSFFEIYGYDEKTIYYTRQGKDKNDKYHTLSISTLKKMYINEENNIILGGLQTYYNPLLEALLQVGKETKIEKIDKKNFYLVIDEINRGNISKIFGELITLIEEDKRDVYEVTLPYSKETFKVPSNLYIIATMNSTDKSIATIDIALRRRFTFLKMKPNIELVKYPEAKDMMGKLNNYITKHLSEEFQLGHSYFMKIQNKDDLEFVKKYKIKPLLEEYFYADDKSVEDILKEALNNEA